MGGAVGYLRFFCELSYEVCYSIASKGPRMLSMIHIYQLSCRGSCVRCWEWPDLPFDVIVYIHEFYAHVFLPAHSAPLGMFHGLEWDDGSVTQTYTYRCWSLVVLLTSTSRIRWEISTAEEDSPRWTWPLLFEYGRIFWIAGYDEGCYGQMHTGKGPPCSPKIRQLQYRKIDNWQKYKFWVMSRFTQPSCVSDFQAPCRNIQLRPSIQFSVYNGLHAFIHIATVQVVSTNFQQIQ